MGYLVKHCKEAYVQHKLNIGKLASSSPHNKKVTISFTNIGLKKKYIYIYSACPSYLYNSILLSFNEEKRSMTIWHLQFQ